MFDYFFANFNNNNNNNAVLRGVGRSASNLRT
jgi:hypothetical protein